MAKNNRKPEVVQGFVQGRQQIAKFLEKEIGSYANFEKEMEKMKAAYEAELERIREEKEAELDEGEELDANDVYIEEDSEFSKKVAAKMNALKAGQQKLYAPMKHHGDKMAELYSQSKLIDKKTLNNLIKDTDVIKKGNIFTVGKAGWNNEVGAEAMKKFTDMILGNDLKKFQYYQNILESGSDKKMSLNEILNRPLPKTRQPEPKDREELKTKVFEMAEKLKNATSKLHRNSAEFKAMKESLKAVGEAVFNNASDDELGKRLEEMQAASMEYVKAKGVGMQSSQMGKDRMDIALDICSTATEYMDFYASKERVAEIERFEKDDVRKILSKNGTFDYNIDLTKDEYCALQIDDELDEKNM